MNSSADALITVQHVSASYRSVPALDDVSFGRGRGVCALLGPNGAGKTTLLSAVLGQKSFRGSIAFGDGAVAASRSRSVGYLPQRFDLARRMRVGETVEYAAWCNGAARSDCSDLAQRSLIRVGLQQKSTHQVRTLSGGERQRLGIACAIARDPAILLLDEPTVGLDPAQRSRLRAHLAEISESTCVILATHHLEDVQLIADTVIVLQSGSVVFDGSKEELALLGQEGREDYESALECAYRRLMDAPPDAA